MSTPTTKISNDEIWFKDFNILFDVDRLTEFVPSKYNSTEEKFNSIMRLAIYSSIILSIYKRDPSPLVIIAICGILTYIIYKNYKKEKFEENSKPVQKKESKVKPTLNNPFMNITQQDYIDNVNRGEAPKYYEDTQEAENLRDDINKKFQHDLYMGIEDAWEKNNSQRQFYTTPNTQIPSDQDRYLEFLYGKAGSCKTNTEDCKPYEDVRGKPYILQETNRNPT